jgi:hypothetical protein
MMYNRIRRLFQAAISLKLRESDVGLMIQFVFRFRVFMAASKSG